MRGRAKAERMQQSCIEEHTESLLRSAFGTEEGTSGARHFNLLSFCFGVALAVFSKRLYNAKKFLRGGFMIATLMLLLVFFGMTADVCACGSTFSFCQEVKEESLFVSVRYREGMEVKRCCAQWNITGVRTVEGCPLTDAISSVGFALYNDPGPSDVLERLMEELRETGGYGEKFTNSLITPALSQGIPHIDRGLLWQVKMLPALPRTPLLLNPCKLDQYEEVDANIDDDPGILEAVTICCDRLIIKGYRQGLSVKRRKLS